jgi:hypothetical protein
VSAHLKTVRTNVARVRRRSVQVYQKGLNDMPDEKKVPVSDAVKAAADDGATKDELAAIAARDEENAKRDRLIQKAEQARFAVVKQDD